ncbi:hypothetical protein H0N95_02460 [Candidatus Micrarchaeota archaeon]|nr:hypothetical protein [Candidatus Micrarchaeota archaeon]
MEWSKAQITDLLQKASDANVELTLTDEQIAEFLTFDRSPSSDIGMNVMNGTSRAILQYGHKNAPYRIKAFEKQFTENRMEVYLFANDGTLCGKDVLNVLYVFDGAVYSVPPSGGDFDAIREKGIKTLALADAFSSLVAANAEAMNAEYSVVEMGAAKTFDDMNVRVPQFLKKYFEKKQLFIESNVSCRAEIKLF